MAIDVAIEGQVLRVRLYGAVSNADLVALADAVAAVDAKPETIPSRFTDITAVTHIDVAIADLHDLAVRRRETAISAPVKSAVVVAGDTQHGMVRMFQMLNTNPQTTLRIFHDHAVALAWLAE